ncbi:glycosyltransferase family 2 protein [bacterium]|jgi:glycosyltransferase involved in cell wall biosynthesis|nr:glycosyltransferase family 2 protein [Candidatus Komeilibacteria bacterium]MBT7553621.1 glycosyltransferase family 2 protein [bacterium]
MKLSIVLPIYNEEGNIKILYHKLIEVLSKIDAEYEILCVNDGSSDKSLEILKSLSSQDRKVKVINFKNNFGQTAAMSAGIKLSKGDIIIPMDADLQNDPEDIPKFLEKIKEGFDVVSGWRKDRKDGLVLRKIPSWIANWIIGKITGVKIHDYGCSMKAYKREVIKDVNLYGEMHRFIPAYASWQGAVVTEMVVKHHPRIHGQTKYGIGRTFKVILDLIVVKFLSVYMNRPIHFFGGLGFMSFTLGIITGLAAVLLRLFGIKYIIETPLPILSALLIIVGVQLVAMGILAEMIMRTYYESQHKEPYIIKDKINFDN